MMPWFTVTSMEDGGIGGASTPRETFVNSDHVARVVSARGDEATKLVFADGTAIKTRESMVKVRALIKGELEETNLPPEPKDA